MLNLLGVRIADRILKEIIRPLVIKLQKRNLIKKWFFIRYSDPHTHLRIRFHLSQVSTLNEVLQMFNSKVKMLKDLNLIWKIQPETYEREMLRYGSNSICLSEELFYLDSKHIVDFIYLTEGFEREELRWKYAITSVEILLNAFKYSNHKKVQLLENLKNGYAEEFNLSKSLKKQLDKQFRVKRKQIENCLKKKNAVDDNSSKIQLLMERRTLEILNIAIKISNRIERDKDINLDTLLSSYIHMMFNRIFKSQQRFLEMVLYNYMWQTYRTIESKSTNKKDSDI